MVTDLFGSLLEDLGKILNIKLQPDSHNSCLLKLKTGIKIQIEFDKHQHYLIIGCQLGTVPMSKYRENLFREALKANILPPPRHGILAYSQHLDSMILFERLEISNLTAEKIAAEMGPFAEKAKTWTDAIARGEIPQINPPEKAASKGKGMFGLTK